MATTYKTTLKRFNGVDWDIILPNNNSFDDTQTYRRMMDKNGALSAYVRTTSNGLLPYSNGTSNLGTSTEKFNNVHAISLYENGTLLANKYLSKSDTTVSKIDEFYFAIGEGSLSLADVLYYAGINYSFKHTGSFIMSVGGAFSTTKIKFNGITYDRTITIIGTANGYGSFRCLLITHNNIITNITASDPLIEVVGTSTEGARVKIISMNNDFS